MRTWHRAPIIQPGSWLDDFIHWLGDALCGLTFCFWLDDDE